MSFRLFSEHKVLREKLALWRPKIAVFNGKIIYKVYSEKKHFMFGKQPDRMEGTDVIQWVMPSTSARCALLPRASDKVPFFSALKKYRDFMNGIGPEPDEEEIVFAKVVLKAWPKKVKDELVEASVAVPDAYLPLPENVLHQEFPIDCLGASSVPDSLQSALQQNVENSVMQ